MTVNMFTACARGELKRERERIKVFATPGDSRNKLFLYQGTKDAAELRRNRHPPPSNCETCV